MKRIIPLLLPILVCVACSRTLKFTIEGNVADAPKEMIYLEQVTDAKIVSLDSVKLSKKGDYKFKSAQPAFPEFYRLRIGNQAILFAVDSTETIIINAQKEQFATNYTVENSLNSSAIKELRNSGFEIQRFMKAAKERGTLNKDEAVQLVEKHKTKARELILNDTRSTVAYYAINQTINGLYLFSPYNKNDRSYWSAVATAFQVFQPENPRTKIITEIVLTALKESRKGEMSYEDLLTGEKTGIIDITLPNRVGEPVTISSLKGKVVLIDFSAYETDIAPTHTLFLRELYAAYHYDGLEIYQISIDRNKLFWLEQTREIPWICVRDPQASNSKHLLTYNVQEIPAWFLIDRAGNIVAGKDLNTTNLAFSIEQQLAKP